MDVPDGRLHFLSAHLDLLLVPVAPLLQGADHQVHGLFHFTRLPDLHPHLHHRLSDRALHRLHHMSAHLVRVDALPVDHRNRNQ